MKIFLIIGEYNGDEVYLYYFIELGFFAGCC